MTLTFRDDTIGSVIEVTASITSLRRVVRSVHDGCVQARGSITEEVLPSPPFTWTPEEIVARSKLVLATAGWSSGRFDGEFTSQIIEARPSRTPGVVLLNGKAVFTSAVGSLALERSGSLDLASPGNFAETMTVTSGTGRYASVSGQLTRRGTLDQATSFGTSTYHGTLCRE
jgi:hypothetical protein